MKIKHSRSHFPWQGWTISFIIFTIIVFLAQSPPHEVDVYVLSGKSNEKHLPSRHENDESSAAGEVVVKCMLSTPYAQKTAAYNPAEGTIEIIVHKNLAPNAANAFLSLVASKHFDGNFIFRVVPGFIVQWGIESPQSDNSRSVQKKFAKVDPPPSNYDSRRSNVRGTLNFAGGNSATGQVYVNKGMNKYLDNEKGSLPFASLGEESMKVIDAVYDGYTEGSGQVKAVNNNEVKHLFPNMSRIDTCWISSEHHT